MQTFNIFPHATVIDTTAFTSLLWQNDTNHLRAKAQYERLLDIHAKLYTSNYLVLEVENWIQEHKKGEIILDMLRSTKSLIEVVYIDRNLHEQAIQHLKSSKESDVTVTDWTTVVLATRLKAKTFSFNQKLANIGALLIPFGE
jgi:predicted nucleic acid-binding protein